MADAEITLLIVDDNDIDVFIIERLLRRLKRENPVVRARNGEEALALLRSQGADVGLVPPYIMLLDINMPRMNGFELLDEIANDPELCRVAVYIQSSSNNERDKNRARQYPVLGYVVKPFTDNQLLEILNRQKAAGLDSSQL